MKKYLAGIFLSLFYFSVQANMAKPWNDGSEHSILFSSKGIDVIKEHIGIKIISNDDYLARFQIRYELNTPIAQALPLLFIASDLFNEPIVTVNGKTIKITHLKKNTAKELEQMSFLEPYQDEYVRVHYEKNESILVRLDDLAYFVGDLQKGTNIITVAYDSRLESNNFGFTTDLTFKYSLAPSKYWKSFGPIKIDLELPEKYQFKECSIGSPDHQNGKNLSWTLKQVPDTDLQISMKPVVPVISAILLFLDPLGIATIAFIILVYVHVNRIKKHRIQQVPRYNWGLAIGNIVIPPLIYAIYFGAYDLIEWTLGDLSLGKHGYIFLMVFTLPVFWVIYDLIMWLVDLQFKKKYKL
jgi:hypothetical protein